MPKLPTWDDVKKLADDLETKVQGAGAAARDRWHQQVKPKLAEVKTKIEVQGQRAGEAIQQQLNTLGDALEKLQHDIAADLKLGKKPAEAPKDPSKD